MRSAISRMDRSGLALTSSATFSLNPVFALEAVFQADQVRPRYLSADLLLGGGHVRLGGGYPLMRMPGDQVLFGVQELPTVTAPRTRLITAPVHRLPRFRGPPFLILFPLRPQGRCGLRPRSTGLFVRKRQLQFLQVWRWRLAGSVAVDRAGWMPGRQPKQPLLQLRPGPAWRCVGRSGLVR